MYGRKEKRRTERNKPRGVHYLNALHAMLRSLGFSLKVDLKHVYLKGFRAEILLHCSLLLQMVLSQGIVYFVGGTLRLNLRDIDSSSRLTTSPVGSCVGLLTFLIDRLFQVIHR